MELHTCLWNDVAAFSFTEQHLEPIRIARPDINMTIHDSADKFLAVADAAEMLLTWEFPVQWYDRCSRLKHIWTPAAGSDWVTPDPKGIVALSHGRFHGPILAESLLSAILFMNHRMPAMLGNFKARQWDRNLQTDCRLLRDQTVLILGYGSIGKHCGPLIAATGARVIGMSRNPANAHNTDGIETVASSKLDDVLPEADHVVLLLPGNPSTDQLMNRARIQRCKPGVMLYNFGRGNALATADIIACQQHIGGAFLDVTDTEPLEPQSPLWTLPDIMITPHSSCVYDNYRELFITEVISQLTGTAT